jgi:hypothetical protein
LLLSQLPPPKNTDSFRERSRVQPALTSKAGLPCDDRTTPFHRRERCEGDARSSTLARRTDHEAAISRSRLQLLASRGNRGVQES